MGGAADDGAVTWDVYREIHKAMRFALFGVTTRAGATDPTDDVAVGALIDEWRDVHFVLRGHHAHEDDFCDPLVQQHAPALRHDLEVAHRGADEMLTALDAQAAGLAGRTASERGAALRTFHLDLADFTAAYLQHLRYEEDVVMPALQRALSNDDLAAVTDQIRGSVPPPDMCVFIRYMVPAMNHAERLDMLGGMHAGAPPEIFEMFRSAAAAALAPADYDAVAVAAGFAGTGAPRA